MKIAKKAHTILCEDVREEVRNKFSLMGVYGKEIIFSKVPALIPKLILVLMMEDITTVFKELHITLKLPKAKPQTLKYKAPTNLKVGMNLNVLISIVPFRVEDVGKARFELRIDKSKRNNYVHDFLVKEKG